MKSLKSLEQFFSRGLVVISFPIFAIAQQAADNQAAMDTSGPGVPIILSAGTYKLLSNENNNYFLTLKLSSVSPERVVGIFESDPYSKCLGQFPISSSVVGADMIIMKSLHEENGKVPLGCNRTVTITKKDAQLRAHVKAHWKREAKGAPDLWKVTRDD